MATIKGKRRLNDTLTKPETGNATTPRYAVNHSYTWNSGTNTATGTEVYFYWHITKNLLFLYSDRNATAWAMWDSTSLPTNRSVLSGAPDDGVIDFGDTEQSIDEAFYTWLIANSTEYIDDISPVYLRQNDVWVKQTAYERQGGEWVLISTALS